MGRDYEEGEKKRRRTKRRGPRTQSPRAKGKRKIQESQCVSIWQKQEGGKLKNAGHADVVLLTIEPGNCMHTYIRLLKDFVFLICVSHVSKGHTAYNIHPSLF